MSTLSVAPAPDVEATAMKVLAVCTGNICRSPAVERLLAHALGPDSDVVVESAGVGAVVGAPVAESMAALLHREGVSPAGFRARQVTEQMLRGSQLVLALTRAHRTRVVEIAPAVLRRTFTLRELARLVRTVDPAALPAGTPAERLAALIPRAAAQRGLHRAHDPAEDDVVDPWGHQDHVYDASFAQLRPAVRVIADVALGRPV